MTEEAYLVDSSVRRFEATVERVQDDRIVLDRTHFYPEGGGQPADRGTLSGAGRELPVTDVRTGDGVLHEVNGEAPPPGTPVVGDLDWERRWAHMRYHTAQHLLSAVLLDAFDAPTVGNQLYADRARIDVAHERFDETNLADIAARINELIDAGLAVDWYEMDRERAERTLDQERTRIDLLPESIDPLRIVEIRDPSVDADGAGEPAPEPAVLDRTACAGTHVRNTADLGEFVVTGRESRGSDAERVRFVLE